MSTAQEMNVCDGEEEEEEVTKVTGQSEAGKSPAKEEKGQTTSKRPR